MSYFECSGTMFGITGVPVISFPVVLLMFYTPTVDLQITIVQTGHWVVLVVFDQGNLVVFD